jgi:hypothetical protein
MAVHKYPYDEMELAFVQGTMSVRQLCKDFDVPTWSTVNAYARRNGWDDKRTEYQKKLREANQGIVVRKRADELSEALDDAVMVSRKAIYAFLDSLEDRWVEDPETGKRMLIPAQIVTPQDFVRITEKLQVLSGQPSDRTAHMGLNLTGDVTDQPDLTMELIRDAVTAAKSAGATGERNTGQSPLPRSETARKVN